jgi:NADH-quinone oxidoreductase subunit C
VGIPEIAALITAQFPKAILGEDLESTPKALIIDESHLHKVMAFLHSDEHTYFDSLSCLTAIDNGKEAGTMEVVYNLYSIPKNIVLMIKVTLLRENPVVDSVADIWRTANWHEREAFDLFGIQFSNHPDLRRILLPNDWEGHPLRKDYIEQDKYHGMTVVYDRNEKSEKWEAESGKKN